MKKIALLLVMSILFSFSVCFADIIVPSDVTSGEEDLVVSSEPETTETLEPTEEGSGEVTPAPIEETYTNTETTQPVEAEKTSNPVGAIVAIVVVIVLVGLVALVSKK